MKYLNKIRVFTESRTLVPVVVKLIQEAPLELRITLGRHLVKTAVSVPSNIAEGHGDTAANFARHLRIAAGSAREAWTQVMIWHDITADEQARDIARRYERLHYRIRRFERRVRESPKEKTA